MSGQGRPFLPDKDSRWIRLVKVWKEEELSISVLAVRFGIRKRLIIERLYKQFGTQSAKVYNSRQRKD